MSDKPLPIVKDTTGLSRGYRFQWRLQYLGFSIFGPADQLPFRSPFEKLKRERALRVLRAHETNGTEAPQDVVDASREL
ncbi:hypothetical protein [Zhihengliuella halotolerans]|uniref:Uncharacterized protein n=1 Tax=Zhihengliuella halotolerans TaxID=370736 RepID=A0A4Q8AH35_9MICC|nr:hypothetical protein [Zhihengliuella halotolerans]RZU63085.1 hypothetical protein EV380_2692 [Zhihengliuella halotolerans]